MAMIVSSLRARDKSSVLFLYIHATARGVSRSSNSILLVRGWNNYVRVTFMDVLEGAALVLS